MSVRWGSGALRATGLSWQDRGGCCRILCSRWLRRDLRCGKLVCEYPGSKPFTKEKATVIYMRVQNKLCVTLDYMKPLTERDPMLVKDGTICSTRKVPIPGAWQPPGRREGRQKVPEPEPGA